MSTFLELCQKLGSESGTLADGYPAAVTSQTGRPAKVVGWIQDAWVLIQSSEDEWLWMKSTFSGSTIASQRNYTGSDFGVASRFAGFACSETDDEDQFTIYDPSIGVSDEGELRFVDYEIFRKSFMRGTQTEDKPTYFTIQPDGDMLLHPIPDAVYTIQGPYRKDVQELSANGDTPEMPARYHDLIVEVGLMYVAAHDESPQIQPWMLRKSQRYNQLRRNQLPRMKNAGEFA